MIEQKICQKCGILLKYDWLWMIWYCPKCRDAEFVESKNNKEKEGTLPS